MTKIIFPAFALALLASAGCALAGWVMNLMALIHWVGEATPEFFIRIVGIFIPIIGAIMGWL
jgi:hypothetical protein